MLGTGLKSIEFPSQLVIYINNDILIISVHIFVFKKSVFKIIRFELKYL